MPGWQFQVVSSRSHKENPYGSSSDSFRFSDRPIDVIHGLNPYFGYQSGTIDVDQRLPLPLGYIMSHIRRISGYTK